MKQDDFILTAHDEHKVFVRRWKPSRKKIKGVVQISHGMAEHSARYASTAQQLCDEGYIVYAHDHRGHGQSMNGSPAGLYAAHNGWSLVKSDLDDVYTYISDHHSGIPIFLLGHSMGSFIALSYLIDFNPTFAGVILSGSNYDHAIRYQALKPFIKAEKLRLGPTGRSPIIDFLTFGSFNKGINKPLTQFDWLSNDALEVQHYLDDEACGFVCTNQLWDDLTDGLISMSSNASFKNIDCSIPFYLFAGRQDPVGGHGKGVRRLTDQLISSGQTDVSCKLYPNGRHEMLNDVNKAEVVNDLISWITAKNRHSY